MGEQRRIGPNRGESSNKPCNAQTGKKKSRAASGIGLTKENEQTGGQGNLLAEKGEPIPKGRPRGGWDDRFRNQLE